MYNVLNNHEYYIADDDEPDCMKCKHYVDDLEFCRNCSPEYSWIYYKREHDKNGN